jgi:tetratricopeptide (TPR) repeat protein
MRHALAGDLRARAAFTRAIVVQDREDSIQYWLRALQFSDAQLAEQPDDSSRMRNVALVEKYLGGRLDGLNRDADAETHYRRALALDEKRFARDPGNRLVQFDLAIDLANVAGILEGRNRIDEAYPMFKRSLELRQRLSSADPKDELTRGRVAYAQMRMARIELKRGNRAAALRHAKDAIAHHESVIARTNGLENKQELGGALVTMATILADRPSESCAAFRRAQQLFQSTGPVGYESYATQAADGVARCAAK